MIPPREEKENRMVYITGDTHRNFARVREFCARQQTTTDDILIILGDAGINYIGDPWDDELKESLSKLPITLFCIHGNHELRPSEALGYELTEFHGDLAYVQKKYPRIVFARDGGVYEFDGHQCLVCGGAYSVDKYYRLHRGLAWFSDEQPSEEIKGRVEDRLYAMNHEADIILTHTCPLKYIPKESFLPGVDQSTVDTSTEEWLDEIEEATRYNRWYCGHYHTNKNVHKIMFLFTKIIRISAGFQGVKIDESEEKCDE